MKSPRRGGFLVNGRDLPPASVDGTCANSLLWFPPFFKHDAWPPKTGVSRCSRRSGGHGWGRSWAGAFFGRPAAPFLAFKGRYSHRFDTPLYFAFSAFVCDVAPALV